MPNVPLQEKSPLFGTSCKRKSRHGFFSNISVAIISTKIPILLGRGFWVFNLPKANSYGFWSMMHEARADLTMLLGCVYLAIVGAGSWSVDGLIGDRPKDV